MGQESGEAREAVTLGTKLLGTPKNSVINVNDILMKFSKNLKYCKSLINIKVVNY